MRSYLILICFLFSFIILFGCSGEQRYTQNEWIERYVPADVNEAQAMVIWERAKIEAETQAKLKIREDGFKLVCIFGVAICVGAILAGQIFNLKIVKQIGILGLVISGVGWGLLRADIGHGAYIGLVGLIIGLIIIVAAFVLIGRTLIKVIIGNELFKKKVKDNKSVLDLFKKSQKTFQNKTDEKIVDKIKGRKK